MRQTLHIFRKDVRFLWPAILAALALIAVFGWSFSIDPSRLGGAGRAESTQEVITLLLVLSWTYLVAAAIHKEPPAGDCQFWVTRPYRWTSLLAAKALLLFAFISLPLFLADVTILAAHGLAPVVARLLMRQALVAGILLLPGAALAAVTRDQAQTAGAMLAAPVSLALVTMYSEGNGWGPLAWMHAWIVFAILLATALGVLVWQYAQRRTAAARGVLAAGAALCLAIVAAPPTGAAFALYGPEPDVVRPAHLCFALSSAPCGGPVREEQEISNWFPIRVEGLPTGMKAQPLLLDLTITGPNGASWRSGWLASTTAYARGIGWNRGWITTDKGRSRWLDVDIGAELVNKFQSQPVKIGLSVAMTIYRAEATTSLMPDHPPQAVAGIGACSVDTPAGFGRPLLSCRTAGYPSARLEANDTTVFDEQYADRAMFQASPVLREPIVLQEPVATDASPIALTTERPIAHIQRDLEIERVRFVRPVVKP